jgi:hypothetical protein
MRTKGGAASPEQLVWLAKLQGKATVSKYF